MREDVYPSWKNEIDSFRQSTKKINEPNPKRAMASFSSRFEENDISDDDDLVKTPFKWAFPKQKKKRHHSNKE